jgi:5-formyltetrahydrofolate cyclo-ligase
VGRDFSSKEQARQWVWDVLDRQGLARFPFPPHGRIPNFEGAEAAAQRLFLEPPWRDARAIKVNPDSPQLHVRQEALSRGIRVYVPTPKLKGGFQLLDPDRIPPSSYRQASTLSSMADWSETVTLSDMPQLDAIVTGCAAVTPGGKRAGKGAGYSDLEYAILLELGHRPVPVATTVHDVQVVDDFPVESNDLPLSLICTPTRILRVAKPPPGPQGVEWSRLSEDDREAMPLLAELRAWQSERQA